MSTPPARARRVVRLGSGPVVALTGLALAALAQAERLPLVAAVALAVALAQLAGRPWRQRLFLHPSYPAGRVWYVGDLLELRLVAGNRGSSTMAMVTVVPTARGLELSPFVVPELRSGETAQVTQPVALTGRRPAGPISCVVQCHHRLLGPSRTLPGPGTSVQQNWQLPAVRPRPAMPPARIVDLLTRPAAEGRGTGRRGFGDPLQLRQFASGDPVSSVHWRSTARGGTPVVMERERLTSGTLVLLVGSTGDGAGWEAAVARAAGLVQAAASLGVPVEVVASSAGDLGAAGGHEAVQDWLAGLDTAGAAGPALVADAVRRSGGGLVAVLSAQPGLAAAAGASWVSVVDLMTALW